MFALTVVLSAGGKWVLPGMFQYWVPLGAAHEGLLIIMLLLERSFFRCPWNSLRDCKQWCIIHTGKLKLFPSLSKDSWCKALQHESSHFLVCLHSLKLCSCAAVLLKRFVSTCGDLLRFQVWLQCSYTERDDSLGGAVVAQRFSGQPVRTDSCHLDRTCPIRNTKS